MENYNAIGLASLVLMVIITVFKGVLISHYPDQADNFYIDAVVNIIFTFGAMGIGAAFAIKLVAFGFICAGSGG